MNPRNRIGLGAKLGAFLAAGLILVAILSSAARAAEPPISQFSLVPASTLAGAHGNLDVQLRLSTGLYPQPESTPFETYPEINRPYAFDLPQSFTVNLPPGQLADPTAIPTCTEATLAEGGECPDDTQIGVIGLRFATPKAYHEEEVKKFPLFNMKPGPEQAALFAFPFQYGLSIVQFGVRVRDESDYGATVTVKNLPGTLTIYDSQLEVWGEPAATEHDTERASCYEPYQMGFQDELGGECSASLQGSATYLVNRPECGPATSTVSGTFYDLPGEEFEGPLAPFPALTGCASLPFEPSLAVAPASGSQADQPAGYSAELTVPQASPDEPEAQASAFLKDLTVTLPQGTAISPAVAQGLGACTDAELGFGSHAPVSCPESSKIGTVSVHSPLLETELQGNVYVGSQLSSDPTSGKMYRLFLVPEGQGIRAKLVGEVKADPATGRLTATFTNNPQVPFDHLHLQLNGGPRAPLANPSTCGTFTTAGELVPWSAPETPTRTTSSSFTLAAGPGGARCASSEAGQPNTPGFEAGTLSPTASAYSPFVLNLSRADGTQRLGALDVTLPKGLLGRIAAVEECPATAIVAAEAATAAQETAHPSCPAASEVGTISAAAGPGSEPFHLPGHVYLSGPYKGAPLSLAIITPALAGPFDLGDVVVRAALEVDPLTTQITVKSDPIPTVVKGVPIDLRSIALNLDKADFTRTPTSCAPAAITASAISPTGSVAALSRPFQAQGCGSLAFAPRLSLSLSGATGRTGHPALKAIVTYPKHGAYSNIRRAQVNLPHSEFLDQGDLDNVCTKPVLQEGKCPASTVYGKARAWSPLLKKPLEGDVYLVGGFGYKLPALVAELDGQIRVLLVGKVDSGSNHGIRNTFEAVPDAPIERFVLQLKGGKKYGLLENSESLCEKPRHAIARFTAQDGAVEARQPLVADQCGKAND